MFASVERLKSILTATGLVLSAVALSAGAQQPASTQQGPPQGERGQRGGRGIVAQYPVLPIAASLPEFSLLGIDGKRHSPKEYAAAKVLAVVFESNHCPASIAYEKRYTTSTTRIGVAVSR